MVGAGSLGRLVGFLVLDRYFRTDTERTSGRPETQAREAITLQ
jgi:hypothetical protein